ncbi:hypothetical protein PBI_LEMURIA_31 [Mycobacterium phage Lemuria]|uniref:Uncharacterized protein n=1 Tax=Mycobacterium phage Lemuria TaxID=2599868 RepID=A0A5J6TGU0_9CAUD|nr:hypothetical protein KDW76_gp31 [Mycobacterium phage Lemuria]QFG10111.1 hypothetical protein PBI_LEMURIA_31 [Mycobacterium phage Lemuria]
MAPWQAGRRHRSWYSDTNLSLIFAFAIVAGYVVWELFGEAPQGMVTLVGLAGGALLGGLTGDKRKREADRDADVKDANDTAHRAEVKADRAAAVAESEHPATAKRAGLPADDVDGGSA